MVRERRADGLRRVSWLADAECQCERGPRSHKYGIHPRGPHRTSITENEQDMSTVDGSTQGDKRRQAIKDVQYQRKQREGSEQDQRNMKIISTIVCCPSCVGLDSWIIAKRGEQHRDESWSCDEWSPISMLWSIPFRLCTKLSRRSILSQIPRTIGKVQYRSTQAASGSIGGDSWTIPTLLSAVTSG